MSKPPRKLTVDELLSLGPSEAQQRQAAEADTRDLWRVIGADGSRNTPEPSAGRGMRSRTAPRKIAPEPALNGRSHVVPAPVAERLASNLNVLDVFELPAVEPPRQPAATPSPVAGTCDEPAPIDATLCTVSSCETSEADDDRGLLRVVEAWPSLGAAVKAAILALIRVAARVPNRDSG